MNNVTTSTLLCTSANFDTNMWMKVVINNEPDEEDEWYLYGI